jgi:hypothetical protein
MVTKPNGGRIKAGQGEGIKIEKNQQRLGV